MTPEERFERIERQLEFSAGILAQLCNSQQRQDAEIEQNSRQIAQLAEAISTLARISDEQGDRIEACFRRMDERQAQAEERMKRTDEQIRRTDEQIERTDEQLKGTDERLKALIAFVERRFSDGRQ